MFDVADLLQRCRGAAGEDPSGLSDDELLAAAVEWERLRSAAETGEARVLAELRIRNLTDLRYGLRTPQWVATEADTDRREVTRRLKLGLGLRRLPAVTDAVASGAISIDHGRVLADAAANLRVGDQVEATQTVWVELAAETSFADWKDQVEHTVAMLDQDGGYDPNRDLARNKLRFTPFPTGSVGVTGELVGEQGLVVRQCVEAHADRLYVRLKRDHDLCPELPLPTRATVLAMALAELVLRGSNVDVEHSTGPACDVTLVVEATTPYPGTIGNPADEARVTRDADGAIAVIDLRDTDRPDVDGRGGLDVRHDLDGRHDLGGRHDLDRHHDDDVRDRALDPYRLADANDRAAEVGLAPLVDCCEAATTPDGFPVPHEVAACLLCDPVITALIVDSLGVPLDMGRHIRLANREQRRALARRDGGCVFPGCDAPVGWCDAHHVTWWRHGGTTDIANLALLCRHHHGVSHRRGWTMTTTTDQWFTWTTPLGQTLHSQRHRGRRPNPHLQPAA